MKTHSKKFLAIGTMAGITLPLATTLACGNPSDGIRHFNIFPTYTGQADQLIALGINADYYPTQLNLKNPYKYLTSPQQYMVVQDTEFKNAFATALNKLIPETIGPSWWNQDAKDSDDSNINNTYWQKQEGSIMFYEHYLLDDDKKIIEKSWAPKHTEEATIQTNFRASRDPYTRLPKGVFLGWDLSKEEVDATLKANASVEQNSYLYEVVLTPTNAGGYTLSDPVKINPTSESATKPNYRISKYELQVISSLKSQTLNSRGEGSWTYNDRFFVEQYHKMFLDNSEYQNSPFIKWFIDSSEESPFTTSQDRLNNNNLDTQIKALFDASTYTEDEINAGIKQDSASNPRLAKMKKPMNISILEHHPIYEQQEGEVGAAPMFEGAMRDNQLYLFDVAWQLDNLATTGSVWGNQFIETLPEKRPANVTSDGVQSKEEATQVVNWIKANITSEQYKQLTKAFDNATQITDQLYKRMADMRQYFINLGVVAGTKTDGSVVNNSKSFGVFTLAPNKGTSTIQTMSKYSFIYKELGFAQPVPANINDLSSGAKKFLGGWSPNQNNYISNKYLNDGVVSSEASSEIQEAVGPNAIFNMDDNGWFWTLGPAGKLDADRIDLFADQFDIGVITARDTNYNAEIIGNQSNIAPRVANLFSNYASTDNALDFINKNRVDYDLWNEGLKTPFVMHMILDKIIAQVESYVAKVNDKSMQEVQKIDSISRTKAINWGNYFTNDFIS